MGMRDEMELLIDAERTQLEAKKAKEREHDRSQRERFSTLRKSLEELVECIEPHYVEATMWDTSARFRLGMIERNRFRVDVILEIRTDYQWEAQSGKQQPAFHVEETRYYHSIPDPELSESKSSRRFDSERTVLEYLSHCVAKQIAYYHQRREN